MTPCRACREKAEPLLNLGPQPVSNRYPVDPAKDEFLHPMAVAQCPACGLIQLDAPVAPADMRARVGWISYKEPEGHLDDLARVIAALPGLSPSSVMAGLTFKDDTLLDRLERLGFPRRWRLEFPADLGVDDPFAGLETLQEALTPERAAEIAKKRGKADVLLVRHVLEHAHDTGRFAAAARELLAPGGFAIFEVPDNARCLDQRDYGALWEEHVFYFTPDTFRGSLAPWGLSLNRFLSYPYPMEDSLIAVAQAAKPAKASAPATDVLKGELARARAFADGLAPARERFQAYLRARRAGPIALFGAGHRSAGFINLLGLEKAINFVVDDDPNKRGLFMPGSRLPIIGSGALAEKGVKLCLLCLSPESERRVVANNAGFVERGGSFVSIFPDSPLSWERAVDAR